jgi:EAL domain-containing protein (putative c-di-GMP-specific phosphodiesterase class I)/DNA-binding NarL/FixJ family response regulator
MSLSNETILIIDDDELQLEIVADDLNTLGVGRVLRAQSGAAALALIKDGGENITTVLTDICMPEMDGPQLLRQLAEVGCQSRIVLVSGVSNDHMLSIGELGRSHGLQVVGFIHKPVSPEVLKTLLTRSGRTQGKPRAGGGADAIDISRTRLEAALKSGEIHPWYQPKVDSKRLRLVGCEALARWRLPDGKLIGPGQFIPAIEAEGLSNAMFFSIFEQTLVDLRRWNEAGRVIKASVNLSMDCAFHLDLPDRMSALLRQHGVNADQVVIEVTESRLMEDRAAALETLTRVSLAGFRLSIDDFGTGYSSLAQVAALPFGELKVDGSFVQHSTSDPKARAIMLSTVTLGRSLGLDVVAEGVETFDQLELLRGCEAPTIQGYLTARPMPADQFERWLDDWRPGLQGKPGCTRQFNLLVVDDSTSMRTVIAAEMAHRLPEAKILIAASGEEALKLAEQQTIDAATLDFHMPGLDGLELLRRLKNKCPAGRYALLTGDLAEATASEATRLGALYCPKPMTAPQADRLVRHFLEP